MPSRDRTVAVLGAGVAGLACARRLVAAGRRVVVFDKGRRPGGRVATRRSDGFAFDHGAQFFTAREPRFAAVVADLQARGLVARWHGPFATWRQAARGADPRPGTVRYVGAPGMSALAHGLAHDLDVRCGWRAEQLVRDRDGYWLDLSGGAHSTREGPFDELVVAIPPRQALSLLRGLDGEVRVVAGSLAGALQPCLCAMVAFAAEVGADGGMFVDDEVLGWAAHDGGKPGRGGQATYVLHGAAGWSAANFERDPEQWCHELLDALARVLGGARAALPEVRHLTGHRWAYALASGAAPAQPFVLQESGLAFCGDALGGGRVEGAFVSGLELGDAMAAR